MGIFNIPDIFQENTLEIFEGLDMVCAYIVDVIVITKHEFTDKLKVLEKRLQKLSEEGLN